MLSRRQFLQATGLLGLGSLGSYLSCRMLQKPVTRRAVQLNPLVVNDVHSQLNPTRVAQIVTPDSLQSLRATIMRAGHEKKSISIAGARHAMGAQQFGTGTILLDTTKMTRVLGFDAKAGIVEVEAGINWPQLVEQLARVQTRAGQSQRWGIAQKQTGADRLCLGGAIAANAHGRGLRMKPLIGDVESFVLVDANGDLHTCSRRENAPLFKLAIGGYGLFGVVYSLKLRLAPRQKIQRIVEVISIDTLMPAFEKRIKAGFLYGDFQFAIDEKSDDFLQQGVFSCYEPVPADTPISVAQKQISPDDWQKLVHLAHTNKSRAYKIYTDYYLSTSGQVYWSDTHQLGAYLKDYHHALDDKMRAPAPATEIITEIYVPRQRLTDFMSEAREDFRKNNVNLIYGTIRLIERDDESFLAWAKQPYACVIFNLHTTHTPEGREHSIAAFRRLIDMAIQRDGNYYLTYHKYATRQQLQACYPQFPEFLRLKQKYDPAERFQSDWYRHYKKLFMQGH